MTENPEPDISPKNHVSRLDWHQPHTHTCKLHAQGSSSFQVKSRSATEQEGDILTCTHGKE